MSVAMKLYWGSPVFAQNAACWLYGKREARARYGGLFRSLLDAIAESDVLATDAIRSRQDASVERLVRHAYDHVPFYRARMDENGIRPSDVRGVSDLQKLPLLTKDDVREHIEQLTARVDVSRVRRHTSGTTGTALTFFVEPRTIAMQWALAWRHRARFGAPFGTRHANFTGKLAVPPTASTPPYWRWCTPLHQAFINMQQLTPPKIRDVVAFLNGQGFALFTGYPSILHVLAEVAEHEGAALQRRPLVVALAAENAYAFQVDAIRRFTGAVVTDLYGMSEAAGNASRCEAGAYHEDHELGVLECFDGIEQPDGRLQGRIVATCFVNEAMPFIRYDTGDVGTWERPDHRCPCGRQSRALVRIEGRADDYVITPDGRKIMRFDYLFKDSTCIKEAQVVQREPGAIVLRIVRRDGYGLTDEVALIHGVETWISKFLRVEFEYVNAIERTRTGKFKAVRSELHGGDTRT
jgi:phenylacetate-CoA ligase